MASQIASGNLIADRYASALYELAADKNLLDSMLSDLNSLLSILKENKNLKLVINSPLISSSDKLKVFKKILTNTNVNKLTLTFLSVIKNNKRFSYLESIINQFININTLKRGDIIADITSANELNDNQKNNVKEQLRKILGEKLSLRFKIDNKIIGGLIVKVGSKMIDTSIANKINKLKIAIKGA